jgi:hypothetical protein
MISPPNLKDHTLLVTNFYDPPPSLGLLVLGNKDLTCKYHFIYYCMHKYLTSTQVLLCSKKKLST